MSIPSYYSRNREKCLAYRKLYYASRVARVSLYNRHYYLANRTKILSKFKERYYRDHPNAIKKKKFLMASPKPRLSLPSESKKQTKKQTKEAELVDSISILFD